MAVDERERLVVCRHTDDTQDRPEDLLLVDFHRGRDVVEEGGSKEEAIRVIGTGESPPVGDQLGAFGDALIDPFHDRGPVLGRVDRAHVHIGVETGADLEPLDPLFHERAQTVGGIADADHQRLGHAALTSRAVAGGDRRVGGELHVGVGQDDHRILGGRVRPDALAVGGAGLVDVPTDRRRADKLDGVDTGVHQQRVDRLTPAVHNVEHAIGEASFLP